MQHLFSTKFALLLALIAQIVYTITISVAQFSQLLLKFAGKLALMNFVLGNCFSYCALGKFGYET